VEAAVDVDQLAGGSGEPVREQRKRAPGYCRCVFVVPAEWRTAVTGFEAAWKALPPTVDKIVVIRDNAKTRPDVTRCVGRAIAHRRTPARVCSTARSVSLDPDPAYAAAGELNSTRVQRVDLTRYFCGSRRCYPVIGNVLVLRDQHHMTATYSTTLGPVLLRKVRPLLDR